MTTNDIDSASDAIKFIKDANTAGDLIDRVRTISKNFLSERTMDGTDVIKYGVSGQDVQVIQAILIGLDILKNHDITGLADSETMNAVKTFAAKYSIDFDVNDAIPKSIIDLFTDYRLGGQDIEPGVKAEVSSDWPPCPNDMDVLTMGEKFKLFGVIEYSVNQDSTINILNDWRNENIVSVVIPQLSKIKNPINSPILWHRATVAQLKALWEEWESLGLLDRIETFNGSFVPRLIRGGRTLSSHAFGTAFDINASKNPLMKNPPLVGEPGSVRELVPSANKFGFFWGGHFKNRPDGMHFEICRIETNLLIT